jgi:hypothetical protein
MAERESHGLRGVSRARRLPPRADEEIRLVIRSQLDQRLRFDSTRAAHRDVVADDPIARLAGKRIDTGRVVGASALAAYKLAHFALPFRARSSFASNWSASASVRHSRSSRPNVSSTRWPRSLLRSISISNRIVSELAGSIGVLVASPLTDMVCRFISHLPAYARSHSSLTHFLVCLRRPPAGGLAPEILPGLLRIHHSGSDSRTGHSPDGTPWGMSTDAIGGGSIRGNAMAWLLLPAVLSCARLAFKGQRRFAARTRYGLLPVRPACLSQIDRPRCDGPCA